MLHKVELLVAGGGPEVLAVDRLLILVHVPLLIHEEQALAFAEGRIGQDHAVFFTPGRGEAVQSRVNHHLVTADAVQGEIHRAHAAHLGREFHALHQFLPQRPLLVLVQLLLKLIQHVLVGGEEEATRSGGGVADAILRGGLHHLHHGADHGAGGEVLPGSFGGFRGGTLEQLFVDGALHNHWQAHPVFLINEVDDELLQQGWVVDVTARTFEDDAQHAGHQRQLFD